jgi:ATP-binding cassette subfamily B protein
MEAIDPLAWPVTRLGEAMITLARRQGWHIRNTVAPVSPGGIEPGAGEALGVWLETAATWLGLEAEPVEVPYAEVAALLRGAGPTLLRLPGREKPGFLVLLGSQRRRVLLLGPDLTVHRVAIESVRTALCHGVEVPLQDEVAQMLHVVGVPRRHQARTQRALLDERLRRRTGEHTEALSQGASLYRHVRQEIALGRG